METSEATNESESAPVVATNFEPLWKKDMNRLRHIRGILLDEKEINVTDEAESPTTLMQDDPVYGRYGSPCASTGQYSCPKCNAYRASQARDLKIHLYRELDYKKFLCSICNEGAWSRALALSHVGKQHPNSGAYIREITSNRALEDWVSCLVNAFVCNVFAFSTIKILVFWGPVGRKSHQSSNRCPEGFESCYSKCQQGQEEPSVFSGHLCSSFSNQITGQIKEASYSSADRF